MNARISVGKKLRFEVFKRDKFTCQYCGAKAPDAVLHVDHIRPVADGGSSDILNLVAACEGCNAGKGARLLDDTSVVERQRAQLEALEARREQLQMMLEWRDELERVKTDTVQLIADRIEERGSYPPNENGKSDIRKWLRRFSFDEVLSAVDESFDIYMQWRGDNPDEKAWNTAFRKIPGICSVRQQSAEKPYLQSLFYTQGILRRRFRDKRGEYVKALEEMILHWDADAQLLQEIAKTAVDWDDFNDAILTACRAAKDSEMVDGSD